VVLCSDGLHGPVSDEEIQEILAAETDLKKAGEGLLQKALERDGPDNITVVLARFDGPGLMEPTPDDKVGFQGYDPGRDPAETGPTPGPDPYDQSGRSGPGGTVASAATMETTEETGVTKGGGAARRLTRVRSTEPGSGSGRGASGDDENIRPPGLEPWLRTTVRKAKELLLDTRARNGRPVLALFFLALLAATAGGIFVLKCERNQAVHSEDRGR
jgi:hypothetical protein